MPTAVIVGLSMGGYVALALMRTAPELVTALVFADTRAGADTPEGRANRRNMLALVDREGPSGRGPGDDAEAAGQDLARRQSQPGADRAEAHQAAVARGHPWRHPPDDASPRLDAPAGLGGRAHAGHRRATKTSSTPVAESRRIAEAIPGSTLVILPKAGHLSNLEQPEAFNLALSGFLATL